jgi:hypothetical protein
MRSNLFILIFVIVLTSSCTPIFTPEVTLPTSTADRSLSTVTLTSLGETSTPTITSSPVNHDQLNISSTGPWLAFATNEGLWAINPDGSGLRKLYAFSEFPVYGLSFQAAPQGGILVFAEPSTRSHYPDPYLGEDLYLFIVDFPDTDPHPLTALTSRVILDQIVESSPLEEIDIEQSAWWKTEQILAAVSRPGSLAWSPSSDNVAFSASLDGPSSDVYLLDVRSDSLLRLTSGLTQATNLSWSPDGEFIIHKAVSDINVGRSGPGLIVDGLWAAPADGSEPRFLTEGDATLIGWLTANQVVIQHWSMPCDLYDLELINVSTGNRTMLWEGAFHSAALDPESGTILLGNPHEIEADNPFCQQVNPSGLYIISPPSTTPLRIGEYSNPDYFQSIRWFQEPQCFLVPAYSRTMCFSSAGELQELNLSDTAFLKERIFASSSYCIFSEALDGSAIAFSDDSTIYVASQPDFQPDPIIEDLTDVCRFDLEWVPD